MRTAILWAALLAQGDTPKPTDDATKTENDVAIAEIAKLDMATLMNETSEARRVHLSARMYLAIKSVEAYRNGPQRKHLKESERIFRNFIIDVSPGAKGEMLTPVERGTHFEVMLTPLFVPGEPVMFDGPDRTLGRSALYAVRTRDLQVTRAEWR